MYKQLTREQRYGIYLGLQEGKTKKAIAQQISVHASTISRELKHNSGKTGRYGWSIAHEKALERRERLPGNRSLKPSLLEEAKKLILTEQWSPPSSYGVHFPFHSQPHKHTRPSSGGQREKVRRLGDGPDYRKKGKGSYTYTD